MARRVTPDHPLVIGRVVGDVVDSFTLSVNMLVMYNLSNQVYNGNELFPSSVTGKPKVDVHGGDLRSFFTLVQYILLYVFVIFVKVVLVVFL